MMVAGGTSGAGEWTRRKGSRRRYCGRPGKQARITNRRKRTSTKRYSVVEVVFEGIEN